MPSILKLFHELVKITRVYNTLKFKYRHRTDTGIQMHQKNKVKN